MSFKELMKYPLPIDIIDVIIDCFFILDMLVTFNAGYYEQGGLVLKRRMIVLNYLKGWFLIDLIASFPYMWVVGDASQIFSSTNNYE